MSNKKIDYMQVTQKAFIVDREKFLVLKSGRTENWTLPGGRYNMGKSTVKELAREIKEETGLNVRVVSPVATSFYKIFFEHENPQWNEKYCVVYLCRKTKGKVRISSEHSDFKWVKIKDYEKFLQRKYFDGSIHSAMKICSILLKSKIV